MKGVKTAGPAKYLLAVLTAILLCGCISRQEENGKIRNLEYTVLEESAVPEELGQRIAEEKTPFMLTFSDQGNLYIARGYGPQEKSGYRVNVAEVYETEHAVVIVTDLYGPEKGEETEERITYPCTVIRLQDIGKEVLFK